MRGLHELIAEVPTFAGLDPEQLDIITGCGRNQHAAAGSSAARGHQADTVLPDADRPVALEIHAPGRPPVDLQTLHEHEVVGWSWLFEPFRWRMDARAVTECGLVVFDAACLRASASVTTSSATS